MLSKLKDIFKRLVTPKEETKYYVLGGTTIKLVHPSFRFEGRTLKSEHTYSFGATPPTITTASYEIGKEGEKTLSSTDTVDMIKKAKVNTAGIMLAHVLLSRLNSELPPIEEYIPFLKKNGPSSGAGPRP
jgi:hypothetical protein